MPHNPVVEELLSSACPSIQYRIRREILGASAASPESLSLQKLIFQDERVQQIVKTQQRDGWLGRRFHGYDSLEAGIRFLCEKGLDVRHPVLACALQALETNTARIDQEMGPTGRILDDRGFGGTRMIQATILAHAGRENSRLVPEQIQVALEGLRAVLKIESVDQIAEGYRDKLVFRPGVIWPGIYHLRLLAYTCGWRSARSRSMVTAAVKRLVALSPLPYINVRHRSQLIAPAAFAMQDFNPTLSRMDAAHWMMWFHRMELLARLGVLPRVPELVRQSTELQEQLNASAGWFNRPLAHPYFKQWGAYTGLMLEQDWQAPRRRTFDLTFRSLLIQHLSAIKPGKAPGV